MKLKILLMLCVIFSQPVFAQETHPPKDIKLHVDENIKWGDYCLNFAEVLEDSRCPKTVNCIWQGQLKYRFSLEKNGQQIAEKDIIIANPPEGEQNICLADFCFSLLDASEYPTTETVGKVTYLVSLQWINP